MIATRTIVAVLAVLGLAAGSSMAQGRGGAPHGGWSRGGGHPGWNHGGGHPSGGWNHGGHYHGGYYYPYWGWGLGVGIGLGYAGAYWGGPYYYGWPYYGYSWPTYGWGYGPYYGDGYYGRPNVYETPQAPSGSGSATASAAPATPPPEPIYYPRNGQSDAQKEGDLRDCNRWATTQSAAMADASVFQRAVLACMDGRGYSGR